jgi:hypothetical protein
MIRRLRGGFVTLFAVAAVFIIDFTLSVQLPTLKLWACCKPGEHIADLIAASGVAVAFVLTYLSALTGLPSPGRQLLASALGHIKYHDPDLAAIDEDGRITLDEFRRLQEFLDDARDLEPNDQGVLTACDLFMLIVNLAKPPHIRPHPTVRDLEDLGYTHTRAKFLSGIVFKRDAEKKLLLRATILCAIIFSYTSLIYCLELLGVMKSSFVIMLGYPMLAIVGAGFAIAMALRMWPHVIVYDVVGAVIPPMEAAMQRAVAEASTDELDEVLDEARRRQQPGALAVEETAELEITSEMIEEGVSVLSASSRLAQPRLVEDVFRAMFAKGFQRISSYKVPERPTE